MPLVIVFQLVAHLSDATAQENDRFFRSITGQIALDEQQIHVVIVELVQVLLPKAVGGKQIDRPFEISYSARVHCEFKHRILPDTVITIRGKAGVDGSNPNNIPEYDPGDIILMAVASTDDPKVFVYARKFSLPVGIKSDAKLHASDVKPLASALIHLGSSITEKDKAPTKHEAILLCDSSNRFERCLGISFLSSNATPGDLELLFKQYIKPGTTPGEALWLDHCLMHVVPASISPTLQTRHILLLKFLEKGDRS